MASAPACPGTVAGLIVVLMAFLAFRVMMIRRSMAQHALMAAAGAWPDDSAPGRTPAVQQGVPPQVCASMVYHTATDMC